MTNKIPDRRIAVEGEVFKLSDKFLQRFNHIHKEYWSQPFTIKPKGEGNSGEWCCIQCGYVCENQIDKDNHCAKPKATKLKDCLVTSKGEPAKHVLAWHSFISGDFEVP